MYRAVRENDRADKEATAQAQLQAIADAWLGIDRSDRRALAVVVPTLVTAIEDALTEDNNDDKSNPYAPYESFADMMDGGDDEP